MSFPSRPYIVPHKETGDGRGGSRLSVEAIRTRSGDGIEESALPRARILVRAPPQALHRIPEVRDRDDFIASLLKAFKELPPGGGAAESVLQVQSGGQRKDLHASL